MIQLDTLLLPDDLLWTDQYRWSPVAQQSTITLAGSLIVQETTQTAGRPITLAGGGDYGWISKTDLDSLRALSDVPEQTYNLTLNDGSTRLVMFTGERITADPVVGYNTPTAADAYTLTLFLMETP